MVVVKYIPLYNRTPILTGPKHIKITMWYENTSRELNPCIRTEGDLGGTIKVPEHRSLGDRAEASVVSSPRIEESTDVVDTNCPHVSILIVRRDVDENCFANQTLVEFDIDTVFEIQIVTIKGEHL